MLHGEQWREIPVDTVVRALSTVNEQRVFAGRRERQLVVLSEWEGKNVGPTLAIVRCWSWTSGDLGKTMRRVKTADLRAAVFTGDQRNTNVADTHQATQQYRHDAMHQTQFCMDMAATQMNSSYERLNTEEVMH